MHSNEGGIFIKQTNGCDNVTSNHHEIDHEDLHCSSSQASTSVAEKRRIFEKLSVTRKTTNFVEPSSLSSSSSVQSPPPKPQRTFAHDHYFSLNAVNTTNSNVEKNQLAEKLNFNKNVASSSPSSISKKDLNSLHSVTQTSTSVQPARPKLIVCRPIVKRWNTTTTSSNLNGKIDENGHKIIAASNNNKLCLPVLNEDLSTTKRVTKGVVEPTKRPKYFQLSHEYEQIFADRNQRNFIPRSASLEEIYYASPIPASERRISTTKKDLLLNNKIQPPLYYCSSPVPVPPPRLRKVDQNNSKKIFNAVESANFITPLTSKPSVKQKITSLRNVVKDSKLLFRDQNNVSNSPTSSPTSKFITSSQNEIRKNSDEVKNFNDNDDGDGDGDDVSTSSKDKEIERRVTRARVVRRQTLMHYDQQETAFKRRKSPQLFEFAVLIELRPNDRSNPIFSGKFIPAVSYKFPQQTPSYADAVLASLPCLCYPDLSKAAPKNPKDFIDELFVITITDQMGDRKFAYCCRYVPIWRASSFDDDVDVNRSSDVDVALPSLPQVLCILTPMQAAQFYLDFVKEGAIRAKMNLVALNEFLRVSFFKALPPPGGRLIISGAGLVQEVMLINRTTSLRGHGLSILLERMNNIDNVLILFASLLSERRVLIVGDTVPAVSKIIQASTMMLWPFEWPHTLIPVIPDSYVQLCFSPTPYLIGVLRSNLHELKHLLVGKNGDGEEEDYILIYDLDYGILKDRDSNLSSPSLSVDEAHRFLPSKIARTLKQTLKSVAVSSSTNAASPSTIDGKISETFLSAFVELVGHYCEFVVTQQDGNLTFQKQNFIQAVSSKSHKMFLKWFVETGMFQVWMRKRLDAVLNQHNDDVFEKKIIEMKTNNGSTNDLFASVARRMSSFLKSKR